jgi:hypothetical protein
VNGIWAGITSCANATTSRSSASGQQLSLDSFNSCTLSSQRAPPHLAPQNPSLAHPILSNPTTLTMVSTRSGTRGGIRITNMVFRVHDTRNMVRNVNVRRNKVNCGSARCTRVTEMASPAAQKAVTSAARRRIALRASTRTPRPLLPQTTPQATKISFATRANWGLTATTMC